MRGRLRGRLSGRTIGRDPFRRALRGSLLLYACVFASPSAIALGAPCDPLVLTADLTIGATDLQYDDTALVVRGATVTMLGSHRFCRLTLEQGAVLQSVAGDSTGVVVEVLGSMAIDASSRVDGSGKGWPSRTGPGTATVGTNGGGGHGGRGGDSGAGPYGGPTYGGWESPNTMGSGGGRSTGGAGGGVISLSVIDTLIVEGSILANGNDPLLASHGGGAGGSIRLDVGTLLGTGTIAANGGSAGAAGGGGGGRIAILRDVTGFSGSISAMGGAGDVRGGAGTQWIKVNSVERGTLRVANAGAPAGARTDLDDPLIVADLLVEDAAVLTGLDGTIVEGDVVVSADAFVSNDGDGYTHGEGPGAGTSGGGGGYGGSGGNGAGGAGGGAVYGSAIFPAQWGSGGAGATGGAGGGRIHLTVRGRLTLDGVLSADGAASLNDSHAGGAGGTVRLDVEGIVGSGTISARGGSSVNSGGGGGGRVALRSAECFDQFDVTLQVIVSGGGGSDPGRTGSTFFGFGNTNAAGGEDDFALPVEPASPSADLIAALGATPLASFDEEPVDGAVATTFAPVWPQSVAATLVVRARSASAALAADDRIELGITSGSGLTVLWSRALGSTSGTGDPGLDEEPWTDALDRTFVFDLTALPLADGGSLDILGAVAQQGALELVVQGHTALDFALLTFCTNDLTAAPEAPVPSIGEPRVTVRSHPNPFNPRTTLVLRIDARAEVEISILDARGRHVTTVERGEFAAGEHRVDFDASTLASGVYFARVVVGGASATTKVVLVR